MTNYVMNYALTTYFIGRDDQRTATKKNLSRKKKADKNKESWDNFTEHYGD